MSSLFERLRELLAARSPRERRLLALGAGMLGLVLFYALAVRPLSNRLAPARAEVARLEMEFTRSLRMVADVRQLQAELARVENKIPRGEGANLFALLESLASEAQLKDRLESIKPKQPSGNPHYPETRVEVSLRGTTLEQTVRFLHKIENAETYLIVRALRIKTRPDESHLLDVSFSVSTFVRI